MDDSIEPPRISLLDVVQERLQKDGKRPLLTKLMYVAKTCGKETNKNRLTLYHEEMLHRIKPEGEKPTGFLLVYPTCCLHVLEGDTKWLMAVLRELHAPSTKTRYVESIRILSCTEDIPFQSWPMWTAMYINSPNLGPYDAEDASKILLSAGTLNINMIKLGRKYGEMLKSNPSASVDSLRSLAADLIPSGPETIFGMILAEGVPSLEEFLEIYDTPVDIDLDSENVWPMPQLLKF